MRVKAQQHQIEALHRENEDLRRSLAALQEQVAPLTVQDHRMQAKGETVV